METDGKNRYDYIRSNGLPRSLSSLYGDPDSTALHESINIVLTTVTLSDACDRDLAAIPESYGRTCTMISMHPRKGKHLQIGSPFHQLICMPCIGRRHGTTCEQCAPPCFSFSFACCPVFPVPLGQAIVDAHPQKLGSLGWCVVFWPLFSTSILPTTSSHLAPGLLPRLDSPRTLLHLALTTYPTMPERLEN